MRRILLLLALNLLAGLPAARAAWYEREEAIMGTRIAVQLWCDDSVLAVNAIDAVMATMHRTDELMSTYKPASQLSQVNAHAFERPVQVDADIIDVVTRSLEYSRISNGAFDITYASVGYLYDYRAHQHPTDEQIKAALPGVDYRQLEVDPVARTIRFLKPGMRIDLGGIAKGWAVDRSIEILRCSATGSASPGWSGSAIHASRVRWWHASRCRTRRYRRLATTSAISRRTASAITTSSYRAPASHRMRCAASRSSAPTQRAPMA
jgi:thiamine biosynthesis lipoprotein ApbE